MMAQLKDFKLSATPKCPKCKKTLYGAMELKPGGEPPKDGDLTMCAYCRNWLIFEGHELREITEKEIAELPNDTLQELSRGSRAVKQVMQVMIPDEIDKGRILADGRVVWRCGCSTHTEGQAYILKACPDRECPVSRWVMAEFIKRKPTTVIYKKPPMQ